MANAHGHWHKSLVTVGNGEGACALTQFTRDMDGWHKDGQAQYCINIQGCNMPRHDEPKLVKIHQEEAFSFES
jgi:hypothetical protein